jgi:exodeoxyribonuclease VII large subunit
VLARLWSSGLAPAAAKAVAEAGASVPAPRLWGVAALLLAVGDALAARFGACAVQGQLSGFTRAASGHCYFTLKDSEGAAASVRCAMFRRAATLLDFAPREGQQVELRGRVAIYEPRGEMQFIVESMRALGAGSLHEQFLRLKAKLEAEGLFDSARKRPLPRFARAVGIVTSTAGAALHDVLSTLARRAPQVCVVVYPSPVQGADAPPALVSALAQAAARCEVDVLIVARGGGSIEDLWAFNDERVVRAVAAMPMPVIAGVGHETDVTLVDFAADLRAPTPTAAAEMAAPVRDELLGALAAIAQRLRSRVAHRLDQHDQRLDRLSLRLSRPGQRLAQAQRGLQSLDHRLSRALGASMAQRGALLSHARERLRTAGARRLQAEQGCLHTLGARLSALDPSRVLARGYVFVLDRAQRPLLSAQAVQPGQDLLLRWHDGTRGARADTPAAE